MYLHLLLILDELNNLNYYDKSPTPGKYLSEKLCQPSYPFYGSVEGGRYTILK